MPAADSTAARFVARIRRMTDEYLGRMLGVACDMANAEGATLFIVDGSVLKPYIVYNLPSTYIQGIGTVRVGEQCCGRAVKHKKPWVVRDMLTDPLFEEGRAGALASAIRAGFSVPVMDGNAAVAAIGCHFTEPHTPTDVDIERNQAIANLFSIVLRGHAPARAITPYFLDRSDMPDAMAAARA